MVNKIQVPVGYKEGCCFNNVCKFVGCSQMRLFQPQFLARTKRSEKRIMQQHLKWENNFEGF